MNFLWFTIHQKRVIKFVQGNNTENYNERVAADFVQILLDYPESGHCVHNESSLIPKRSLNSSISVCFLIDKSLYGQAKSLYLILLKIALLMQSLQGPRFAALSKICPWNEEQ